MLTLQVKDDIQNDSGKSLSIFEARQISILLVDTMGSFSELLSRNSMDLH